ncbi:hypothetical protein SJ05684_c20100 [Sinorhizobium sojae CCBAU 05684]|uniref:Uncharacterized protein n=1 Tax=Sinorhizobium sojae CCBAU 05684 TaxID=716928 RepID=A0A249PCG2_9HYPH|nr:hypothetical protein SJ05684_c20100 [Sinorhizobium sojae CCBAU 05684]
MRGFKELQRPCASDKTRGVVKRNLLPPPLRPAQTHATKGAMVLLPLIRQRLKREHGEDARKGPIPWLPPQL